MTHINGTLSPSPDRLEVLHETQRELLLAHEAYVVSLRLVNKGVADEFVRSRVCLIESMAVARDHITSRLQPVRHTKGEVD